MNLPLGWLLIGVVGLVVVAPLAVGVNQSWRRRREQALGTRRKTKIRL